MSAPNLFKRPGEDAPSSWRLPSGFPWHGPKGRGKTLQGSGSSAPLWGWGRVPPHNENQGSSAKPQSCECSREKLSLRLSPHPDPNLLLLLLLGPGSSWGHPRVAAVTRGQSPAVTAGSAPKPDGGWG